MSTSGPCSLLELSAELRLDIYHHLVLDCLSSGRPAGLAGLFLSCRSIQCELQAEFSKIGPLLRAQSEWNKQSRTNDEVRPQPLRLQLAHQLLTPNARPADLTIVLPILSSWLFQSRPYDFAAPPQYLEDNPLFISLLNSLQDVLCQPWSVLTINFCKMSYARKIAFGLTAQVSKSFFTRVWHTGVPQFTQVDRLVLNYGCEKDLVDEGQFEKLFHDFFYVWRHSEPIIVQMPVRGWITRVQEGRLDARGWKVALDFKDDLKKVEGALWEIAREDGCWKPKRLFEGDLDEVLADQHWEREYDTDGKRWGSSGEEDEAEEDEEVDEEEEEEGDENEDEEDLE